MVSLYILIWLGVAFELFLGTFIYYLAVMMLKQTESKIYQLHWLVRWAGFIVLFLGLLHDIALNWFVLTIIFLEPPFEFLSTARIVRHVHHSKGFRYHIAYWFCKNWLTPFDAGHCD